MAEEVYLTAAPLYMHFRQTHAEEITEGCSTDPDFLLRDFEGRRYTSRLTYTVLNKCVRLQNDLYQGIRVKLTKLKKRVDESDSTETEILRNRFNGQSIIDDFDLSLGRTDEQTVKAEINAWKNTAIEYGIEPVIQHFEEYLTAQADIPKQPTDQLHLRHVPSEPSSVMTELKNALGKSTGAIVATGVKWYDERAEGLDMAEKLPIVSANTAPEYEQRGNVIDIICEAKDRNSYMAPRIVCVTDIDAT
jgi:hypothetical protein